MVRVFSRVDTLIANRSGTSPWVIGRSLRLIRFSSIPAQLPDNQAVPWAASRRLPSERGTLRKSSRVPSIGGGLGIRQGEPMAHYVAIVEDAGPDKAIGVWFPDLPGC